MKLELKRGIYCIRSRVNGKVYIGSAVNFHHRIRDHRKALKGGKHGNRHLQNHFNKYGEVFEYEFLIPCLKGDLIKTEQTLMNLFDVTNRDVGFNINPIAGSMLGYRFSEEAKRNLSRIRKGVRKSRATVNKMIKSKLGSNHPSTILTESDVRIIKNTEIKYGVKRKLAEKYQVSEHVIGKILNGQSWKHVN